MKLDMLKRGSFWVVVFALFHSCLNQPEKNKDVVIKDASVSVLGKKEYQRFYRQIADSLSDWLDNDLYGVMQFGYDYKIDSVFCVNSKKDRIVGIQLMFSGYQEQIQADGIQEFLGAKVDGRWYFWTGGYKPVIRSAFKGHDPKQPLSYEQLHSQALKMMSGYVTEDGKINDKWFDYFFEGPGWGSFNEYHKDSITIHGEVIHNNNELLEYYYKMNGRGLWIKKAHDEYMKYKKEHGLE